MDLMRGHIQVLFSGFTAGSWLMSFQHLAVHLSCSGLLFFDSFVLCRQLVG